MTGKVTGFQMFWNLAAVTFPSQSDLKWTSETMNYLWQTQLVLCCHLWWFTFPFPWLWNRCHSCTRYWANDVLFICFKYETAFLSLWVEGHLCTWTLWFEGDVKQILTQINIQLCQELQIESCDLVSIRRNVEWVKEKCIKITFLFSFCYKIIYVPHRKF